MGIEDLLQGCSKTSDTLSRYKYFVNLAIYHKHFLIHAKQTACL